MSKAMPRSDGYELGFNEAACPRCGTPVCRGCACADLLPLPGELAMPAVNHGYEDDEDDLLPIPGDAGAPFAVNDDSYR